MKRAPRRPRKGKESVLEQYKLSNPEARFLVANYYEAQRARKRADMQLRHLGDRELPLVLRWTADQNADIEVKVKKFLENYANSNPIGVWAMSHVGIGPVIAAGCLAHLDITKAPTAGHFHSFCGLNPEAEWKSSEWVKGFVAAQNKLFDDKWRSLIAICEELHRKPLTVLKAVKAIAEVPGPDAALALLRKRGISETKAQYHADNILNEAFEGDDLSAAYDEITGGVRWPWKDVTANLSKRPWNADMRQIMWHLGQSAKKQSGKDNAFYGLLYRERKDLLEKRNEEGRFSERAKTFKTKSADWKKILDKGELPAGNIDSQACNFVAKIFLSHLHAVMYWSHFGKPPPKPYPITILGHAHEVKIPNLHMWPGLEEAYYGRRAA